MPLKVQRADVWAGMIDDKPGGLVGKLEPLTQAGASFQFLLARRKPNHPNSGVVFLTPLKGAKQMRAAQANGFTKVDRVQALRIEAADKPGLGVDIARKIAAAGINLRGFSAAAVGKTAVIYLGFDGAADVAKALKALKGK